jgi:plastocyanin
MPSYEKVVASARMNLTYIARVLSSRLSSRSSRLRGYVLALTLVMLAGCDRGGVPEIARAAASGEGVISGRVTLVGFAPLRKVIPGSPMVSDESIVTGPKQGLKNVIVYLKDAPKATFVLKTPVVLDQIKCVYVPHVVAVQTGQTLRLKSSDALMHNVHLKCAVNPDANYGFPSAGQRDIQLALPEAPFSVRCDVHPWMSAWVGVFDHPWFAVTGEDGSFTIEHVPPGTYTLVAWQEVLPEQEEQVTVSNGGETKVDFAFAAP